MAGTYVRRRTGCRTLSSRLSLRACGVSGSGGRLGASASESLSRSAFQLGSELLAGEQAGGLFTTDNSTVAPSMPRKTRSTSRARIRSTGTPFTCTRVATSLAGSQGEAASAHVDQSVTNGQRASLGGSRSGLYAGHVDAVLERHTEPCNEMARDKTRLARHQHLPGGSTATPLAAPSCSQTDDASESERKQP